MTVSGEGLRPGQDETAAGTTRQDRVRWILSVLGVSRNKVILGLAESAIHSIIRKAEIEARNKALEEAWQPIETAPQDGRCLLLFGVREDCPGLIGQGPHVFSGFWDHWDEAWCSDGSRLDGPFYKPTHWMPLPLPPAAIRSLKTEMPA